MYEQAIKPLSSKDKLTIARLIISEIETIEPEAAPPETGFDALKKILPTIERISLTEEDLASVNWDRQIAQDVEAGRFDTLRERVREQRQAGQCRLL